MNLRDMKKKGKEKGQCMYKLWYHGSANSAYSSNSSNSANRANSANLPAFK